MKERSIIISRIIDQKEQRIEIPVTTNNEQFLQTICYRLEDVVKALNGNKQDPIMFDLG